jgi:1,4-beta-D-xylan synthase
MAPPQAPANGAVHGGSSNGGVVVADGGMAPSSENGAGGGHHGGSIDGVVGGTTTVPSSVAANGNGKQHGTRERKRKKKPPAVSPMDKYWTPIDDKEAAEAVEDGGEDGRRPLLFRTYRVKGILLHPYRCASIHLYIGPQLTRAHACFTESLFLLLAMALNRDYHFGSVNNQLRTHA